MMLYIASDKKLPTKEWETTDQYLCVNELDDVDEVVKKQFSKKYVYYIGSYQGCGCGFSYGYYLPERDDVPDYLNEEANQEERKRKESVKQLFDYIKDNIKETGEIELYSCWSGDEGCPPEYRVSIKLKEFILGEKFRFEEKQLINITL